MGKRELSIDGEERANYLMGERESYLLMGRRELSIDGEERAIY